jgi:hypothetical protein
MDGLQSIARKHITHQWTQAALTRFFQRASGRFGQGAKAAGPMTMGRINPCSSQGPVTTCVFEHAELRRLSAGGREVALGLAVDVGDGERPEGDQVDAGDELAGE